LADATIYSLQELAYDPFKATEITQRIEAEGIVVIPFRQGPLSFGAASAEMERLVLKQGIAHGGNPVLAWMMSNVVMRIDSNANAKPDKEKSREKIDGVIAMLMALDRAVRHADTTSVYESRGVLTFGTGG
jgi:phage terminase large subunit-like protein